MCGIVGYLGNDDGLAICLSGLKRLEYRGYDSAGLAIVNKQKLQVIKVVGGVVNLEKKLNRQQIKGRPVIAHTRWATYGEPIALNAHPHCDCRSQIAVVHNGIIENYNELKKWLVGQRHQFVSQTDTEVIAHLIEENYQVSGPRL